MSIKHYFITIFVCLSLVLIPEYAFLNSHEVRWHVIGRGIVTPPICRIAEVPGDAESPRVLQENLIYQGAFRLQEGDFGGSRFNFGGTALTYHPGNNSLFIGGHNDDQMIAEISIPEPSISDNSNNLPVAG